MSAPVTDWPRYHARRAPERLALVDLHSGRRHNWRTFDGRIDALSSGMQACHRIGRGDRVAVLMRNSIDVFTIQFACWRLGAIFVPLNWRLTRRELTEICADCSPKLLIAGPEYHEVAAAALPPGTACLPFDDGAAGLFEDLAGATVPGPAPLRLNHDDLAAIIYTSGTTGRPKGALITHGMVFWNAVNLGLPSQVDRATVHLTVLPLFHTAGLNAYGNVVVHAGGVNVVMREFDPGRMLHVISDADLGITHTYMVPSGYQFMLDCTDFARADLSRLRIAGTGGSPCSRALLKVWADRGVALQQGYGMTETSPTVMLLDTERAIAKLGSAGLPALHTEVRLVDERGARIDRPDVTGEIQVRGPNVTPGYWNAPDVTADAFADDGWFRTGDAAHCDADGFYFIVDRWKDIYISGGENVSPAEVEHVLQALPEIAEAAVIGVPDNRWGEVGQAVLALREGATLSTEAVISHCRRHLAGYKIPRHVRFAPQLPRTASGKVQKHVLRAQYDAAESKEM